MPDRIAQLREVAEQAKVRWREATNAIDDEDDDIMPLVEEEAAYKAWVAADFALRLATGEQVRPFHLRVLKGYLE